MPRPHCKRNLANRLVTVGCFRSSRKIRANFEAITKPKGSKRLGNEAFQVCFWCSRPLYPGPGQVTCDGDSDPTPLRLLGTKNGPMDRAFSALDIFRHHKMTWTAHTHTLCESQCDHKKKEVLSVGKALQSPRLQEKESNILAKKAKWEFLNLCGSIFELLLCKPT